MADLDISEHRKPQDGKIDFARFGGPHIELRIVTVPTRQGHEDVVLRLLSGLKPMPLDTIGLAERNLAGMRTLMSRPYGLILICGPTGCGKTTTLHSVMREMNTEERNIWTAEDPVEITQAGLRQVQINARIGWTFAAAMRTFLRADPDVIMIGEMRDEETARIAVEASLTGHLVMSTLHTNSAAESVTRLLEIGIDPFTFADSLLGVMAQRLVRRLCTTCRRPEPMGDDVLQGLARDYLGGGVSADEGNAALVARWRRDYGDEHGRLRDVASPRLRQVRRPRLPRSPGPARVADRRRAPATADSSPCPGQRVAGRGVGQRHGDPASGRHREGARRPDRHVGSDRGNQCLSSDGPSRPPPGFLRPHQTRQRQPIGLCRGEPHGGVR